MRRGLVIAAASALGCSTAEAAPDDGPFGRALLVDVRTSDFTYENDRGVDEARFMLGAELWWSLARAERWTVGAVLGAHYLHVGERHEHFFSTVVRPPLLTTDNVYGIPLRAAAQWRIAEPIWLRGAIGGTGMLVTGEPPVGFGVDPQDGSSFTVFPGLDGGLGWDVGRLGVSLTGGWIPTPAADVVIGSAGLVVPLG